MEQHDYWQTIDLTPHVDETPLAHLGGNPGLHETYLTLLNDFKVRAQDVVEYAAQQPDQAVRDPALVDKLLQSLEAILTHGLHSTVLGNRALGTLSNLSGITSQGHLWDYVRNLERCVPNSTDTVRMIAHLPVA